MAALRRLAFAFGALCMAAPWGAAWAQAAAGSFLAVTGEVEVVAADGSRRPAEQGSEIRSGETVVTGENSLAQMRMADRSLFSVRANSEFKLDQFKYAGSEDRDASFVVSIIKGGFRTITGLIAQLNRRNYRITTPAATIGVRGTHFEVVHVLPQVAAPDVPPGTYNRVYEGITTLQNPGGIELLVNREQTAFAALQANLAPVLVAPPTAIFGQPTPVPRAAAPRAPVRAAGPQGPARAARPQAPGGTAFKPPAVRPTVPGAARRAAPVVREGAPALRTPSPTIAPRLTPLEPTSPLRTLEPTTPLRSPELTTISPTISPTLTPLEPKTSISPTLTPLEPLRTLEPTTTISPTISPTTTVAPTTTTTTTTISPTSPTLQLQSPIKLEPSPTTTIRR